MPAPSPLLYSIEENDDYVLLPVIPCQLKPRDEAQRVSPQSLAQEIAILRKAVGGNGNARWVTLDSQD